MLLDPSGNSEHVGVEDQVLLGEADIIDQDARGARQDLHAVVDAGCLTVFVERP